tara:strand:+ start:270 stop:563 length:294 start_codon:yes stop_codon:yes gene_type:complete
MYIILSQTPDKDGFQGQVALNTDRINGFREVSFKDIGGNSQKDKSGYVGTYTEVLLGFSRSAQVVLVSDPISSILGKINESSVSGGRISTLAQNYKK